MKSELLKIEIYIVLVIIACVLYFIIDIVHYHNKKLNVIQVVQNS